MLPSLTGEFPLFDKWWGRCKSKASADIAEIGPARGDEADFYKQSGMAVIPELEELIHRVSTTSVYDLGTL